jgi:hypothetical protein
LRVVTLKNPLLKMGEDFLCLNFLPDSVLYFFKVFFLLCSLIS